MKKITLFAVLTLLVVFLGACNIQVENDKEGDGKMQDSKTTLSEEASQESLKGNNSLPIGTVVKVKGADMEIMIIGILQRDMNNPTKTYDYSGVFYPVGLVDPDNNLLFDKTQIEQVYYLGYHSERQDELQQRINEEKEKLGKD